MEPVGKYKPELHVFRILISVIRTSVFRGPTSGNELTSDRPPFSSDAVEKWMKMKKRLGRQTKSKQARLSVRTC